MATGSNSVPIPEQRPTHPLLTSKPIPEQRPITIKEQSNNNFFERALEPPSGKTGSKVVSTGKRKPRGRSIPTAHPVFLEWNAERVAAGLDPSVAGPQNNVFAAKLQEAVPDADFRRKVLKAFFARKEDVYLVKEGFVFFQLVNHRLDQCIATARKRDASAYLQ